MKHWYCGRELGADHDAEFDPLTCHSCGFWSEEEEKNCLYLDYTEETYCARDEKWNPDCEICGCQDEEGHCDYEG